MKVTVFLEGSPGHEKQSLSIVEALGELVDLEVERIQVRKTSLFRRLSNVFRYIVAADGGCEYDVDGSDLLIGTGSSTHIPLLSCKKKYQIPAVTCMAPEPLLRSHFNLCFIPRHDGIIEAQNIFITDGPPVFRCKGTTRDENCGLILLGGIDDASHVWNDNEICSYISEIAKKSIDIQWKVSSSPRTPETTVERIKEIEKTLQNVTFYHFKDTPSGWVEEQYALATYAWVSADSMSMVYEAITAGCSVGVLPVRWKKDNNKFQTSLDQLYSRKLAMPFDYDQNLPSCSELGKLDEASRCAVELVNRFANRRSL